MEKNNIFIMLRGVKYKEAYDYTAPNTTLKWFIWPTKMVVLTRVVLHPHILTRIQPLNELHENTTHKSFYCNPARYTWLYNILLCGHCSRTVHCFGIQGTLRSFIEKYIGYRPKTTFAQSLMMFVWVNRALNVTNKHTFTFKLLVKE